MTMRSSDDTLVFSAPALSFTEACPVGNGRMGGLLFGGFTQERIVLNEEMMWSGSPQDADRPDAHQRLPEIRKLIFDGQHAKAQQRVNETFTCAGPGSGRAAGKDLPFGCYQKFGELLISFDLPGPVSSYHRELDLPTATASVVTRHADATLTRRFFTSAPDDVLVYRVESSIPFSLTATLAREERGTVSAIDAGILLQGSLSDGRGGSGVHFAGLLHALAEDGSVCLEDANLVIRDTTTMTLLVTMATAMNAESCLIRAAKDWENSQKKDYKTLAERHVDDFQSRYSRVSLDLPSLGDAEPTPLRLQKLATGHADPSLYSLYFQYGRYLLLSSSRPGNQLPANLQGIWAEELQTPWNGDFHLNINVQMNYWPAEVTNLAECHEPLIALTERLVPHGRHTARAYYHSGGWVAHMMTTPWLFTSPGEDAHWGASNTGGAWLCQHLWAHYAFGGDIDYLRRIYPVLKEAAQFFLDFLVEDPTSGYLVTCPSSSPENVFRNARGEEASVCSGPTIDNAIIRELFGNVVEAARLLDLDAEFAATLQKTAGRLPPYRIGRHGQLQEWLEDYEETDPDHRHFSHLYGLYPGSEIAVDPILADAARISLIRRGEFSTGWSTAWKACCWARLRDGEKALGFLQKLFHPTINLATNESGGSYPNLFCAHPPFQIDGNFGGTAAIAEMLLQSHRSDMGIPILDLLPALPLDWHTGSVHGLRARGGIEVSLHWANGALAHVSLTTSSGHSTVLQYADTVGQLTLSSGPNFFLWRPSGFQRTQSLS